MSKPYVPSPVPYEECCFINISGRGGFFILVLSRVLVEVK